MQTITTVTEQIRKNIRDYETSTGKIARDIEISGSALDCLLREDKDFKNTRAINRLLYLDLEGQGTFRIIVNVFPLLEDSLMFINKEGKHNLELPFTDQETG